MACRPPRVLIRSTVAWSRNAMRSMRILPAGVCSSSARSPMANFTFFCQRHCRNRYEERRVYLWFSLHRPNSALLCILPPDVSVAGFLQLCKSRECLTFRWNVLPRIIADFTFILARVVTIGILSAAGITDQKVIRGLQRHDHDDRDWNE
nr:hypothetical protein CFP56_33486 [Quercus suber]